MFTWLKTHQQLIEKLKSYQNRQKELITILKDLGITNFQDEYPKGTKIDLEEIDPFSFFCYLYKHGESKNLENLKNLARHLSLEIPNDIKGLPNANAQKVWLFPYKYLRQGNEITRLWIFFNLIVTNQINNDSFADILRIKNVGKIKLTEALFYINPEKYLPLNEPLKKYLKEAFGIETEFTDFKSYLLKLEEIRNRISDPFYKISLDGYLFKPEIEKMESKNQKSRIQSLNTILFGPPGTGKTHSTIEKAIEIVDPEFFKENKEDRKSLKRRFNELLIKDDTKGQIMFCTFHQSFSYEDFVEGIKPLEPREEDTFLKYKVEDGVFKKICRIAESQTNVKNITSKNLFNFTKEQFKQTIFYKLSLGDSTKEEDQEIYEYCISNNMIAIGFAGQIDFSGKSESEVNNIIEEEKIETFAAKAINYFKNYLKIGNYVIISNGNSFIRAIAKVTGDYEYHSDSEIKYKHFRKVEWIFKDVEIPVSEFYEKNLSQQTIYKLKSDFIKPEFFVKDDTLHVVENGEKNYVLLIDEINRGNVSAIFGELITLIEDSKRAGKDEELEVILPYSKKPFKVPENLFIIGTMNTADRSVEALDTALRRRFTFEEMSPDYSIIEKLSGENGVLEGVNLVKLLDTVNSRLEILLDKDHKIGHSYFLGLKNLLELKNAFRNKILPLFEEYFFGDFGKLGLVLGSSFVQKKNKETVSFAKFEDYDPYLSQDLLQKDVFTITDEINWDFKSIYE
jgi:hypothetical protein